MPDDRATVLLHNVEPGWTEAERAAADEPVSALAGAMAESGCRVEVVALLDDRIAEALAAYDPRTHLVLNWCESLPGVPHSEPMVARSLEALGFTFTGAGPEALELCCDKPRVKEVLEAAGVPTPAWRFCDSPSADGWDRFPAIVKTVHEHSSEGITSEAVVMGPEELDRRIAYVLETYRQPALVEDFIDGREFHVSLWGNGRVEMLPPAEMDFSGFAEVRDRLCTYEAKFVPGSRHYDGIRTLLPAPLSVPELAAMKDVCQRAYRAAGCRDYGRIDLRARDGIFYILDVNPNADISSDASFACAAEVAGISYGEVGLRLLELAAHRQPPLPLPLPFATGSGTAPADSHR